MNIIKNLSYSLMPLVVAAAEDSPVKSVNDVIRILNNIVKWTYTIFFIAAVFFILLAAYKFLFAQDDPEKIKSAKNQIIYAVIAIIVALLAVSFPVIIKDFLGGGSSSGGEVYGPPNPNSGETLPPSGGSSQNSYDYDPYAPWGINP
ncbi:MAG: hypothetical protein AAB366_03045 [Patescibacteria group bacterium]